MHPSEARRDEKEDDLVPRSPLKSYTMLVLTLRLRWLVIIRCEICVRPAWDRPRQGNLDRAHPWTAPALDPSEEYLGPLVG